LSKEVLIMLMQKIFFGDGVMDQIFLEEMAADLLSQQGERIVLGATEHYCDGMELNPCSLDDPSESSLSECTDCANDEQGHNADPMVWVEIVATLNLEHAIKLQETFQGILIEPLKHHDLILIRLGVNFKKLENFTF
jgi:hypothetical protein